VLDVAVSIAIKGAHAFLFVNLGFVLAVVVGEHSTLDLLRCKRHVKIKIEIAVERGNSAELPSHTLLERLNFRPGGAGNDRQSRIALSKVNVHAVEVVGQKEQCSHPCCQSGPNMK
jgi:hypothetical protein